MQLSQSLAGGARHWARRTSRPSFEIASRGNRKFARASPVPWARCTACAIRRARSGDFRRARRADWAKSSLSRITPKNELTGDFVLEVGEAFLEFS